MPRSQLRALIDFIKTKLPVAERTRDKIRQLVQRTHINETEIENVWSLAMRLCQEISSTKIPTLKYW